MIQAYDYYELYKDLHSFFKFPIAYEFFILNVEEIGYDLIENYSLNDIETLIDNMKDNENLYYCGIVVFAYMKKDPRFNTAIFNRYLDKFLKTYNDYPKINCEKIQNLFLYLRTEKTKEGIKISIPLKKS